MLSTQPGGAPAAAEKSPRREGPCKPSLAFWGQGWGKFWGVVVGFFSPQWEMVGLRGELCSPLQLLCYTLPSLSDFVPIDLEEWWAQQFLAKIENCS